MARRIVNVKIAPGLSKLYMSRMQTLSTADPTNLSDEDRNQIKSLVPAPKFGNDKRGRSVENDRRSLFNAILYVISLCSFRIRRTRHLAFAVHLWSRSPSWFHA